MRIFSLLFSLVFTTCIFSQVGVGTTNPDASSILDVTATDKGVLVPRVSLTDVTNTTTPINTPATGLLIWNTNAAVTGGNGVGFYFFNGAQWIPIQQTITDDADFYESNTTNAPDDINDNIYTLGSVNIGDSGVPFSDLTINSSTNNYAQTINQVGNNNSGMDINITNNVTSISNGINIDINNTGTGNVFGEYIALRGSSSGITTGLRNWYVGSSTYSGYVRGVANDFYSTTGISQTGIENSFFNNGSTTKYGINNIFGNVSFTTVNGTLYGVYNDFSNSGASSTGNKYGLYNEIPSTVGGTHYGIYSDVTKSNSYSAYFLGRVSIGTTTLNNYIFPNTRGTDGQIMQTDGAGNVTWEDNVNPVSSIPIYSNGSYNMNHGTGGVDLSTMDSSIEPSIYNTAGNIQIKLVVRYTNALGTNNFQLRVHDGLTESYPITNASGWTFAATQNGGVATSDWVNWSAGTNAHEIHVFGWNDSNNPASDSITINNAYLLVRSQ